MKYMASYDIRLLGQALTPSIFSTVTCVTLTVVFIVAIVIDVQLKGSFLPIVFFDWGNMAISDQGDKTYSILLEEIAVRLSAFTVWAVFGTLLVILGWSIWGAVHHARELRTELEGRSFSRKTILADAVVRFLVRAAIAAAWAVYMWLFFAFVLNYAISAATVGSADLPSLTGVVFIAAAALLFVVGLYVHVVFLRILLLRPRVFGVADYVISTR